MTRSYLEFEDKSTEYLETKFRNEIDLRVKEMMRNEILRQRIALRDIWLAMGNELPIGIAFSKPGKNV